MKLSRVLRRFDWLSVLISRPPAGLPPLSGPGVVLGSAPDPALPADWGAGWSLITVNASQVMAEKLGLPQPDMTVISGQMMGDRPVNIEAQKVLAGRSTRALIYIDRGVSARESTAAFARIGYGYDSFNSVSYGQREKINRLVLGADYGPGSGERKISTGLFAALLAVHLGAGPVVMSGFSLNVDGHAYNSLGRRRQHKEVDARVLAMAIERGLPIFAADPAFALQSGLSLHGGQRPHP